MHRGTGSSSRKGKEEEKPHNVSGKIASSFRRKPYSYERWASLPYEASEVYDQIIS